MLVVVFWFVGWRRMVGWGLLGGQRVIAGWVDLEMGRGDTFALPAIARLRPAAAGALR